MTEKEDFYRVLVSEARPNPGKVEETSVNKILQYGLSTGLIFFCTILFLILIRTWRLRRGKLIAIAPNFSQVPCKKCRFFSSNPYLRCAIHPSIVLTPKAVDCSDYWSEDGKFPQ
ncbi:MAG: hypothetical protein HC820_10430 [Hydrococcus sp. RM1_1_31]|nr:hypothetical protein [Hydrococcus sp. RM1_1_31]